MNESDRVDPADLGSHRIGGDRRLEAFVPELAAELGAEAEPPVWRSVDGSMLSADISGFTALSEKLAGKGKAGAEEITELINVCFTALIDAAYDFGGEVLKFGGDALLVMFRGARHQRRAADAGLAMQRALHASPAAKRAHLTMTVGVAEGPFDVFLVGSGYRELLVTGPRATEVIRLEGEAAKGDTLVSASIARHLSAEMLVREEAGGWVVDGCTGDEPTGPIVRTTIHGDLEPYVPVPVIEQLDAFESLGGEHRLVTVGFVMVTGVAAALDEWGARTTATLLGRVVDAVVGACEQFGVTALHTDIAPDGVKFVLCAGAPVNPGDTTDALLQAALAIRTVDSPLVIRQGVQTGRVFAGFLGSDIRRTYTLMGDPVNTAARMLGKAGDREIVAVESVIGDTRTVFSTTALDPFMVKGKTEPITAHRIDGVTDRSRRDVAGGRMVGRRAELAVLARAIGALDTVVQVIGPAGVGKSRLLDAAWDASENLAVHQGTCTPYGTTSPYSLFRPLLRGGYGMPLDGDPVSTGNDLRTLIAEVAPELAVMLPLLAIPFGADVGTTPEVDAIGPEFRRARLHDAVVQLLDATVSGPLLLVAEDAQWIDEASAELLTHLVRASAGRPWSAVVSLRGGAWRLPDDIAHVTTIELGSMQADEIRQIALDSSPVALSDAEVDEIVRRADGNPMYAIELTRAIRDADSGIPDTIEELISARVDALDPASRRLIRIAAVFGTELYEDHLATVLEHTDGTVDLDGSGLGDVLVRRSNGRLGFQRAMYRDVAYEGLPYRQRRDLHERVAETLEAAAEDPGSIADLLSLHYAEAGRHRDAYRYAVQASRSALDSFAHVEAASLLERALQAGRYHREVTAAERAELYQQLGRAREFSGQLQAADRAYQRVRSLTDDLEQTVDALRRQARLRQKQRRLTAATKLLRRAEALLADAGDEPWVSRRLAEINLNLSGIRMDQGRLAEARRSAELAEGFARAAEDEALQVQAFGAIVGATTDWAQAEPYVERGLGPDAPSDAYEARSILAINLGMSAFFAGRWRDAVELYETGRQAADAMGNVTAGALAAMNAAEVLVDQGRLEAASDNLTHVRRVLRAAGYEAALLYAEMLTGAVELGTGDVAASVERLTHCASAFRDGAMLLYALEAELLLAEARLAIGDIDGAEDLAGSAMHDAPQVARHEVVMVRAHRVLGEVAAIRGERGPALRHLDTAVEIARRDGLRFELGRSLAALSAFNGDAAARAEADRIFADLGVITPRPSVSTAAPT